MEGLKTLVDVDRNWVPFGEGYSLYLRPVLFATEEALMARPANKYMFAILATQAKSYYTKPVSAKISDYYSRAANGGVDKNTITTLTNGDNTTVTGTTDASGNKEFKVAVNKDLTDMNSATFGNGDERNVVDKTGIRTFNGSVNTGITANGVVIENTDTLEQASYTGSGMQASDDNATIRFSTIGIDAGNQIINGVKSGVADTDAVNVKQLKELVLNMKIFILNIKIIRQK